MKTNRELCIEMWEIIAKEGVLKSEAFSIMRKRYPDITIPKAYCFACEEAKERSLTPKPGYHVVTCFHCPIDWGGDTCEEPPSPYHEYDSLFEHPGKINKETIKTIGEKVLKTIKETWE